MSKYEKFISDLNNEIDNLDIIDVKDKVKSKYVYSKVKNKSFSLFAKPLTLAAFSIILFLVSFVFIKISIDPAHEPKKPISCAELLFKISFKWKGFLDNYLKKSIIQSTFNSITLETSARTKVKNIIFDNEISFELLITKKLDKIILKDGEIKNEVDIWQ